MYYHYLLLYLCLGVGQASKSDKSVMSESVKAQVAKPRLNLAQSHPSHKTPFSQVAMYIPTPKEFQKRIDMANEIRDKKHLVVELIKMAETDLKYAVTLATLIISNIGGQYQNFPEAFVKHGFLPVFIKALESDIVELQVEALAGVINIATSNIVTKAVIDAGAIDPILQCVQSDDKILKRMAVFALANLMGNEENCDTVTQAGVLDYLVEIVEDFADSKDFLSVCLLHNTSWALSNIGGLAPYSFLNEQMTVLISNYDRLLKHDDDDVKYYAAWGVHYIDVLLDGRPMRETGIFKSLLPLLDHPDLRLVFPVLNTFNDILERNLIDNFAQKLVDQKIISKLKPLYKNNPKYEELHTALTKLLAYVTTIHDEKLRQEVFDMDILPFVTKQLKVDFEKGKTVGLLSVKKDEAFMLLYNLAKTSSHENALKFLDTPKLVVKFGSFIASSDEATAMEAASAILLITINIGKPRGTEVFTRLTEAHLYDPFMKFLTTATREGGHLTEIATKGFTDAEKLHVQERLEAYEKQLTPEQKNRAKKILKSIDDEL